MAKTQFSFGPKAQDDNRMKSLYTSEIDAQAKQGGNAADGRAVKSQLKRTNVTIGSIANNGEMQTEAQNHFGATKSTGTLNAVQKEKNLNLVAKLKGSNFSFREQKQGG